jgi:hypothetical protein
MKNVKGLSKSNARVFACHGDTGLVDSWPQLSYTEEMYEEQRNYRMSSLCK